MEKKLFIICAFAFIFSFGCLEKEKVPESKTVKPAQTQQQISGAPQPSETSISGLKQANENKAHLSGN